MAAVYQRDIRASIERVWENVYDWEHLPWLHSEAFASIDCLDAGSWGWHARIGFHGGAEAEIELLTEPSSGRYVTRTRSGFGAPSEIWTSLEARGKDVTAIEVEFCIGPRAEEKLRSIGASYTALYERLWSEDEEMMRTREAGLLARSETGESPTIEIGPVDEVLRLGPYAELCDRLPMVVEWGGRRFRVAEIDGLLWAHSVVCPHWLGPLEECGIVDGQVVCPWHGYAFDVRTGSSSDGRRLRLAPAPAIRIEPGSGEVVVSSGRIAE